MYAIRSYYAAARTASICRVRRSPELGRACTSTLDEARTMKPTGTEFARALHKGYIDLAKQELDRNNFV